MIRRKIGEFVYSKTYRAALDVQSTAREKEKRSLLPEILDSRYSIRDTRVRFAHAWLSVPSGTAGLLLTKWTIRNDTGGCHFSAKCRALSAGDDGSRFYIFFFLSLLLCLSLLFSFVQLRREYFRRKSCALSLSLSFYIIYDNYNLAHVNIDTNVHLYSLIKML